MSPDGYNVYFSDGQDDGFYQIPLTTAFDLTTADTANKHFFDLQGNIDPYSMDFNADGTMIYYYGYVSGAKKFGAFNVPTAWDLSSQTSSAHNQVRWSIDIQGDIGTPNKTVANVEWKSDGSAFFVNTFEDQGIHLFDSFNEPWLDTDYPTYTYQGVVFDAEDHGFTWNNWNSATAMWNLSLIHI